jgi:hypothetical protein
LAGLTFDTAFLIAIDRDDRSAWSFWRTALDRSVSMTVPAPVVAQAWRGDRTVRMAMFLNSCSIDGLTDANARQIGELWDASKTSDVVDAALVLGASARQDRIVTGDMTDISRLAGFVSGLGKTIDVTRLPRR